MSLQPPSPPTICAISQCRTDLDFQPLSHWPEGLPAVAINRWVVAGFHQTLVFNHQIPSHERGEIKSLFCSLYNSLTFAELARLLVLTEELDWFPCEEIFAHYQVVLTPQVEDLAYILSSMPSEFQRWCAEKKMSFGDLQPLLSSDGLNLSAVLHEMVRLNVSRALGVQILELAIDLLQMHTPATELLPEDFSGDNWLTRLKSLRFPQTFGKDRESQKTVEKLPWPGSGQVRWARQGDRAGIELKLFVSKPSDLKKYIQSLSDIQEMLENESDNPWIRH